LIDFIESMICWCFLISFTRQVVDSLLLLFKRISDVVRKHGTAWVWRVQDGQWFTLLLQSAFRAIVNNNTFRFETHDLTFFYSEAARFAS
jgi:hypothetical protein